MSNHCSVFSSTKSSGETYRPREELTQAMMAEREIAQLMIREEDY